MSHRERTEARANRPIPRRALDLLLVAVLLLTALGPLCWQWIVASRTLNDSVQETVTIEAGMDQLRNPDPRHATDFRPIRVLKRRPAIVNPPVASADDASGLDSDELVLGIEIDEQARAYPLTMLNGPNREIFNDQLGDVPLAATW